MGNSAIILAGGSSTRVGQDKGLVPLANKPLIVHVLDAVDTLVDERIIVTSSRTQAMNYAKIIDPETQVIIDRENMQTPLLGALTGFEKASGTYSLLLPCDTPLVLRNILSLLLELCMNKSAAIPRWPDGCMEPLQAAYHTDSAFEAAASAINNGGLDMRNMIDRMKGVRYISTLVLQQLDPALNTFFNVNTELDMNKAAVLIKRGR